MTTVSRAGGVYTGQQWGAFLAGQGVDFDREAFARLITDKGYDVRWEKAVLCPNVPATALAPKDHVIACPHCGGFGFVYVQPCDTRMLMIGMRMEQAFYANGRWDGGTMMVTGLPDVMLGPFDRLTLLNGTARFAERPRRGPGTVVDQLKYAALGVLYASWIDRAGALRVFAPELYDLVDGKLRWTSADRPDDGAYYTIAYTYRPRYVVTDLTHHHRESTVGGRHLAFPVQGVARLDFLVRDESLDAPQVVDENPFPDVT